MKHMRFVRQGAEAFALPTILIASVVMLTILAASVVAVGAVSVSLDSQYYNQLGREAAESGMARATDCLKQSPTSTPQWSDAAPLRPNTNCDGSVISGMSEYINPIGNVKTTFRVGLPSTGSSDAIRVSATGSTLLTRSSDSNTIWRKYSQSVTQDSRYRNSPKIAGGAGWQDMGHIATITSVDNKLYGFGYNVNGQITANGTPASVMFPLQYGMPAGVTNPVKVKTSGQGASFVCMKGNNSQLYCRGDGLSVYTMNWTQMALPAGVSVNDFWLDGYGWDAVCVLGSDQQGYCSGENDTGSLGAGTTTYGVYPLSAPRRFMVPAGVNLKKILPGTHITCGITTTGGMYCAGRNDMGQIGGPTTSAYGTPIPWPVPGFRSVQDVIISYHTMNDSPVVHALMTDGTIWSTGTYQYTDHGNGQTSGSTGTSQSPTLFTSNVAGYRTGAYFQNPISGRCIDNQWGGTANGNTIQLWDCNQSGDQLFIYGADQSLTFLSNGKCLDVPGNSMTRVNLQLYDCNGTPAQKFQLTTDSSGRPIIKHISSGLCVDASNAGTANGTVLQTWTCNNNAAQVYGYTGVLSPWTNMIVGSDTFCAYRADQLSGLWCAGQNNWGQLANYATTNNFAGLAPCAAVAGSGQNIFNVNLPNNTKVDISKLTDEWKQHFRSLMVIGTDGNVYGAGRNQYGKLGNGSLGDATNDYRSCTTTKFQLPAGVTAIDMSTRDEYTTYVLGSDNRIYAAGRNNNGQIGDGTTVNRPTPVEVKIPRQATYY